MCLILLHTVRDHFSTPLVYISHARILGYSRSALESNVAILKSSEESLLNHHQEDGWAGSPRIPALIPMHSKLRHLSFRALIS